MPNRIIKESICASPSIDRLRPFEEVFFYRLIVNCDDYGRLDARPAILKARLFPLRRVSEKQIAAALAALAAAELVEVYAVDGQAYLRLPTWERHQQIRAKRSRYPAPGGAPDNPGAGVKAGEAELESIRRRHQKRAAGA